MKIVSIYELKKGAALTFDTHYRGKTIGGIYVFDVDNEKFFLREDLINGAWSSPRPIYFKGLRSLKEAINKEDLKNYRNDRI